MATATVTASAKQPAKGRMQDVLASVVVFLVALPLCMGVAIASGAPPAAGLITGIVGGILVGSIAGAPLLVSGPAAGMVVLVYEVIQQHGLAALGAVVLLSGVIQILAGLARTGIWFRMVSPAVVNGMLAGIGLLIVVSQLHVVFDAKPYAHGLDNVAGLPARLLSVFATGVGVPAAILGLATIAIMMFWEKLRPKSMRLVPGALLAVILVTLAAQLGDMQVNRVQLPDNLLASIQWLTPTSLLSVVSTPSLIISAFAFAFIASAETLLAAAAVDRMHDGVRSNFDRELFAQGVGNTICGMLGALPMTGVIVRSAANVQAGAVSRLSAILHGAWLLGLALLLPWLLRMMPVSCLAAILVYTGLKMVKPAQMKELAEYGKGTVAVFVITALTIVATDLLTGVAIGVAVSVLRLALRAARLHVNLRPGDKPGTASLRLVGSATFLNIPWIAKVLAQVEPGTTLTLDTSRLRHIDHASLVLLQDWARTAPARGCSMIVDWAAVEDRTEGGSGQRELAATTA
jgi:MFS superfamily sulfate permease-like transporter